MASEPTAEPKPGMRWEACPDCPQDRGGPCHCWAVYGSCGWRQVPAVPESDFTPRPWTPAADYYIANGIDIRDVIEAFGLNYNRGAVVKYMARAGRKPGNDALLDLLKAREHINREIARLEATPSESPGVERLLKPGFERAPPMNAAALITCPDCGTFHREGERHGCAQRPLRSSIRHAGWSCG